MSVHIESFTVTSRALNVVNTARYFLTFICTRTFNWYSKRIS